jgi:hypothetical protein
VTRILAIASMLLVAACNHDPAYAAGNVTIMATQGTYKPTTSTIATGGTSQQALPANPGRLAYVICNNSAEKEYINFGAAASASTLPIAVSACVSSGDGFVSTQQINIFGATTADAYYAAEGQ